MSLQFPDRPDCFQPGFDSSNASCNIPTFSMFQFLNITSPEDYFQLYCINPPDDSCSFGYCPNSDIAGPAVRIASKFCGSLFYFVELTIPSVCQYDMSVRRRTLLPRGHDRRLLRSITANVLFPHRGRHRDRRAAAHPLARHLRPPRRLLPTFPLSGHPRHTPFHNSEGYPTKTCLWI